MVGLQIGVMKNSLIKIGMSGFIRFYCKLHVSFLKYFKKGINMEGRFN